METTCCPENILAADAAAPQRPPGAKPARIHPGILLIVALAAFAVFANSLPNRFALDDWGIIAHNPTVTGCKWAKAWTRGYWPTKQGLKPDILYRPVTITSYIANEAVAPHAYWAFHLVNVVLYALVSVMVSVLAWRLVRRSGVALAAGLLFAVHPLHTEVAANVVGRAELLAALFALAALLLYLPHEVPAIAPEERPWWNGLAVGGCMFLALLCKETPAGMLVAFPLLDAWQYSNFAAPRPALVPWLRQRLLRYQAPLWGFFGVYMALRLHAVGLMASDRMTSRIVNPLVRATPLQRIFTPFMLLAKYVMLFFWPARLSADYSAPSLMPVGSPFNPMVLLGMAVAAAVLLATATYWRRKPAVAALCVLLALAYGLVANVLRIGTIFGERLFFWPSVFLTPLLCVAGADWLRKLAPAGPRARRAVLAAPTALGVILGLMAWRTMKRNPAWKDNCALALATAAENPDAARNCVWAGAVLLSHSARDATPQWVAMKNRLGLRLLHRATKLWPSYANAYWTMAHYQFYRRRYAAALIALARGAMYRGGMTRTRWRLNDGVGKIAAAKPKGLLAALRRAMRRHPADPTIHFAYALALCGKQKYKQAAAALHQTLVMNRGYGEAIAQLGMVEGTLRHYRRAVVALRIYVMHAPVDVEARCALANALMHINPRVYPQALAEAGMNLRRAAKLLPHWPEVVQLESLLRKKQSHAPVLPKVRAQRATVAGSRV